MNFYKATKLHEWAAEIVVLSAEKMEVTADDTIVFSVSDRHVAAFTKNGWSSAVQITERDAAEFANESRATKPAKK